MTARLTESERELTGEWCEIGVAERNTELFGNQRRFVTAVYEHVPSAVKIVVQPVTDDIKVNDNPEHEITVIEPLYESMRNTAFIDVVAEIEPVLAELTPKYPEEQARNASEQMVLSSNEFVTVSWAGEAEFDWRDIPSVVQARVETLRQYPLDYTPVLDNPEPVTAVHLERKHPGIISEPIETEIVVEETESGELDVALKGGALRDVIQQERFWRASRVDVALFEAGTVLARVELSIDLRNRGWGEYSGVYRVESVEFTVAGTVMMPPGKRVTRKMKSAVTRFTT